MSFNIPAEISVQKIPDHILLEKLLETCEGPTINPADLVLSSDESIPASSCRLNAHGQLEKPITKEVINPEIPAGNSAQFVFTHLPSKQQNTGKTTGTWVNSDGKGNVRSTVALMTNDGIDNQPTVDPSKIFVCENC